MLTWNGVINQNFSNQAQFLHSIDNIADKLTAITPLAAVQRFAYCLFWRSHTSVKQKFAFSLSFSNSHNDSQSLIHHANKFPFERDASLFSSCLHLRVFSLCLCSVSPLSLFAAEKKISQMIQLRLRPISRRVGWVCGTKKCDKKSRLPSRKFQLAALLLFYFV